MTYPIVGVALVTRDGEKFLEAQLRSIAASKGVKTEVFALDLESSDGTMQILEQWKGKGLVKRIYRQPKTNPTEAFRFLVKVMDGYEWIAFSDQDDIWSDIKLLEATNVLSKHEIPVLFASNRSLIDSNDIPIGAQKTTLISKWNALVENPLGGNTMVLNSKAKNIFLNCQCKNIFMYDSYLYLVFSFLYKIIFDERELTKYRIHTSNLIGIRNRNIIEILRVIKFNFLQVECFRNLYGDKLSHDDLIRIDKFLRIWHSKNIWTRMFHAISTPSRRSKIHENILWICLAPMAKWLK